MVRRRDLEREPSLDGSVRSFVPHPDLGGPKLRRDPDDLTAEQSWHPGADGTIVDPQTDMRLDHSLKIVSPSEPRPNFGADDTELFNEVNLRGGI